MNARRTILLVAAVALLATACGGDDASEATTTTPVTTEPATAATTTPPGSTEPSTVTSQPSTTLPPTTTAPPTTTSTTTTTTTLPPGAHPVAGILWSDLLPGPSEGAVYRVDMVVPDTPMSYQWGVAGDLNARMEYGVEWFGREGTYDRLVLGLDGEGTPGVVFYFHLRDDPWVIDIVGMEAWPVGNIGRGPEAFVTPVEPFTLDLSGQPGETFRQQGNVTALDSYGLEELPANVAVTLRDADAGPVTLAAGTFEEAMVYEVVLSGQIVGGPEFVIEITVSAGNLILQMSMPGAGIELLEPWG